jgi:hypothetical protein
MYWKSASYYKANATFFPGNMRFHISTLEKKSACRPLICLATSAIVSFAWDNMQQQIIIIIIIANAVKVAELDKPETCKA